MIYRVLNQPVTAEKILKQPAEVPGESSFEPAEEVITHPDTDQGSARYDLIYMGKY